LPKNFIGWLKFYFIFYFLKEFREIIAPFSSAATIIILSSLSKH
jgi:hypothetical protein